MKLLLLTLYAKIHRFKSPVAVGSGNSKPSESMGVLLLNSTWPGFHLWFGHGEFNMQQGMKAFCSWFMKYISLCQITGLWLVYVNNKDRVRSFFWKHSDCCHLIQTKSLSIISNVGFTEWIWAVIRIPREEHQYENRCYIAALMKFKSVTADTQKKMSVLRKRCHLLFVCLFPCTVFLSIRWPPLEIQK